MPQARSTDALLSFQPAWPHKMFLLCVFCCCCCCVFVRVFLFVCFGEAKNLYSYVIFNIFSATAQTGHIGYQFSTSEVFQYRSHHTMWMGAQLWESSQESSCKIHKSFPVFLGTRTVHLREINSFIAWRHHQRPGNR